jgi:hypothetical protein
MRPSLGERRPGGDWCVGIRADRARQVSKRSIAALERASAQAAPEPFERLWIAAPAKDIRTVGEIDKSQSRARDGRKDPARPKVATPSLDTAGAPGALIR